MMSKQKSQSIKAIPCSQNGIVFYSAVMSSSILKEVCFVSRRESDPRKGFQRTLNENRAKNIAAYLDSGKKCIPSSLILSAQNISNISYDKKKSELTFSISKNSFLVLDGQHRLFGYFLAKEDYAVPVVIFNNLNITAEVNLFIDINTNQKGVPATLLLDIKNIAGKETSLEEKQRTLFDYLDKNSVLAGRFSANKSRVGYISRLTFNEATKNILESGYFKEKDVNLVCKAVKNYLEAADQVLNSCHNEKVKLTNGSLFKAVFAIFNECIDKAFDKYQNIKVKNLKDVLTPISNLSYDSYVGSSNATVTKMVADMKAQLREYSKYSSIDEDDIF
ncbi:MAG: DGQHR domain-containing protein [Fibrobacter sp.]|nr:DGQHR domain-containing protein [Fibrobacter sp.]